MATKRSHTAGGIRARNRAALEAEILRLGEAQLTRVGAGALSLRAIARELGMASSAIYRYVSSRDELLTLLIIDAFNDYGETVEAARDTSLGPKAQFMAYALAMRKWALRHPHRYSLIYGSPVPDYIAPAERTNQAGVRVPALFLELLAGSDSTDLLHDPDATNELLARIEPQGFSLQGGIAAWLLIMGSMSAEIFGHLGPSIADPEALFRFNVAHAWSIATAKSDD